MSHLPLDAEGLLALTDIEAVWAVVPVVEPLRHDTSVLLFIGPGCPVCPHQVRAAATVAAASPRITLEIIDATLDPGIAAEYDIQSVPTTVIDDELFLLGAMPARRLAERIMERHGPDRERVLFASLMEAGRHDEASRRLSEARGIEAFAELWSRSTLETRMGLMLVAEQTLEVDPGSLDPLVPLLLAGLDGHGPLASDQARRGDTADLLARIGHPDARPALERLAEDANAQVAEAARAALDEMAGGT